VYDPPMICTILSGRWVGNTVCPAKSSTKGGHPNSDNCGGMSWCHFTQTLIISVSYRSDVANVVFKSIILHYMQQTGLPVLASPDNLFFPLDVIHYFAPQGLYFNTL
jgi:hypothetical protein